MPGAALCDRNQTVNISMIGGHLDMRKLCPQDFRENVVFAECDRTKDLRK
jgi:hypothetical protein